MPTAEYEGKVYEDDQQYEDDKKLVAQFFMAAVHDVAASAEAGRAIYREVPNIRVLTPGSRDVMVTKATEVYQNRFPKQWERFKKQLEQVQDGTPLELVPWLTIGVVAELKAANCFTLEQLAGMSDSLLSKMMGMQGFRQKARLYLENAASQAPFTALEAKLAEKDNQIEVLKRQMEELQALVLKNAAKE